MNLFIFILLFFFFIFIKESTHIHTKMISLLNSQKLENFKKIIRLYKDNIDEKEKNFDIVFTSTVSNILFVLQSFLLLVEYNIENSELEDNSVRDQKQTQENINKKLQTTLKQKTLQNVKTDIESYLEGVSDNDKKVVLRYLPSIISNVKNTIMNDYMNQEKKYQSTSHMKTLLSRKLVKIQTEVKQKVNNINYNFYFYVYITLIDVVVIFFKYLSNIDNFKVEGQNFLNKNQKVKVSSEMKKKFNNIALQDKQSQVNLMNDISRLVVTGLKQKNII